VYCWAQLEYHHVLSQQAAAWCCIKYDIVTGWIADQRCHAPLLSVAVWCCLLLSAALPVHLVSPDAVVATSMSLINRFALLVFPLPTIILLLQMLATLAILYPLLLAKVLDFPVFRWTRFVQLFGIGALYTANTAFALYGLKAMNLPM
jgi:hypothetical protein